MEEDYTPRKTGSRVKLSIISAVLVLLSGVALAWLSGRGFIFGDPGLYIGFSITVSSGIICCIALCQQRQYAGNITDYHEMEIIFEHAMMLYEEEEYEKALKKFDVLIGPKKDHKRALFYAAKCSEALDDWLAVKRFIKHYLELVPKDREAWELLSRAHKKLFEFEKAAEAEEKAKEL
ncbi:MAG: hypothetical protein BAJATHORv1_30413 [Candidatus Thorarchaeota archaeon]|nr:MAG: hypothetical protein BAJATHORv1_30413 [Candidatus Thorarchaeota archaeon]